MNPRRACFVFLIQLVFVACKREKETVLSGPAAERLQALSKQIEEGRVGSLDILQIGLDVEYITSVTEELLESDWQYRFENRRVDALPLQNLAATLRSSQVASADVKGDFRWGVIFYSKADPKRRLGAIYFDRTGRRGSIDGLPIAFKEGFFARLKSILVQG
jgi:hypothetical protein